MKFRVKKDEEIFTLIKSMILDFPLPIIYGRPILLEVLLETISANNFKLSEGNNLSGNINQSRIDRSCVVTAHSSVQALAILQILVIKSVDAFRIHLDGSLCSRTPAEDHHGIYPVNEAVKMVSVQELFMYFLHTLESTVRDYVSVEIPYTAQPLQACLLT